MIVIGDMAKPIVKSKHERKEGKEAHKMERRPERKEQSQNLIIRTSGYLPQLSEQPRGAYILRPDESVDELQSDLKEIRNDMGQTISALRQRLNTQYLKDEAVGRTKELSYQLADRIRDQVIKNPYPFVLMAAGLGLLFGARSAVRSSSKRRLKL
jgi:ElaB/YqjD/DUF883 family membrane-anchored ribosome-binding protein